MPSLASSNNSNPLSLLNDSTSFLRRCGFTLTFNYITHQHTIGLGFVIRPLAFPFCLLCTFTRSSERNEKKLNWTITPYLRFMDGICAPCVKVVIVCKREKKEKKEGKLGLPCGDPAEDDIGDTKRGFFSVSSLAGFIACRIKSFHFCS